MVTTQEEDKDNPGYSFWKLDMELEHLLSNIVGCFLTLTLTLFDFFWKKGDNNQKH